MTKPVRTRFAPSPTGLLHVGGVRTALFAYLFAKANNGQFILRLEDTDRERFVEHGVEQIVKSLDWVGTHPDEGVWYQEKPGKYGPYIQSERLHHYQKYAQQLIESGDAYYSYITPEAFSSLRNEAIATKKPFVYKQTMEPSDTRQSTSGLPIRLKVGSGTTIWTDEIRGDSSTPNELIDDFVILKADGYPTYNFANVIDDHLMQISHVIRGDEFLSSTSKHALLFDVFGWQRPKWVHVAPILGPDGKKKLSKRDGDVDILDFKEKGYLPEALFNFLALLGWNDGSEQEVFSKDELIAKFSINRIQKSPAAFDIARLDWMNGEYIRKIPTQQLLDALKPFIPERWYANPEYLQKVVELEKERLKTLAEAQYIMEYFFEDITVDSTLLLQKGHASEVADLLREVCTQIHNVDFTHDALQFMLKSTISKNSIKPPQLFMPMRVALTGREHAPGVVDIVYTLGKEKTLSRLESAIDLLT